MAHLRKRFLENDLKKALSYSPLVGILGHRQTGKTTLTSEYGINYLTLDKKDVFNQANDEPEQFVETLLSKKKLSVIDECQLAPPLFPALKEWVRTHKQPNQCILTGSVRFSSKRAIRESLTGRIINLELLPMSISEIQHKERPDCLKDLLLADNLDHFADSQASILNSTKKLFSEVELYLERGGLPGICFVRDNSIRDKKISDLVDLILDRDLRQIHQTQISLTDLKGFLNYLAENEGRPINYSNVHRQLKISDATQKKLLYALESIFVLRLVPIAGGINSKTYYFEDQAEANFFSITKNLMRAYEGLVYRHIRIHFHYGLQNPYKITQYLSRGKSRVPFVIEQKNRSLGVMVIEGQRPNLSEKQSGNSFLRKATNSNMLYLSLVAKPSFEVLDVKSMVAPLHWIL